MEYCIGIDMGGTTTKFGLFSANGKLIQQKEIPTRVSLGKNTMFQDIARTVKELAFENSVDLNTCGIGMGVAGPVEESGYVEAIVNLNMYNFYPGKDLSALLGGIPVVVGNDANVAALGEMWQGGGKGHKSMVFITLGTGVGSGVIVNEKIVPGAHGLGGEIGHIWVNPEEPETCSCGGHGCLDQMASATGIVRNVKRFLEKESIDSSLRHLENMTAKDVFDAAKSGDGIAEKTIDYCMSFLGKNIADINYIIDPEVVVIGGGLSKAGKYLLDVIFKHYTYYPRLKKCRTEFVLAQLGGNAGMYGAARLALDLK